MNIPYEHTIIIVDDLSSNHLPVILQIHTNQPLKHNRFVHHTDWNLYRKIYNTFPINQNLQNQDDVDKHYPGIYYTPTASSP